MSMTRSIVVERARCKKGDVAVRKAVEMGMYQIEGDSRWVSRSEIESKLDKLKCDALSILERLDEPLFSLD